MKIAIYSGAIPSTTFVEHLIEGIEKQHKVYLFGVVNKPKKYASKNIRVYSTSKVLFKNIIKTKWHVFVLLFTKPQRLFIVLKELKKYTSLYAKWNAFSRLIPVVRFLPGIFHIQWAKDLDRWLFLKEKLGVKIVLSLRGAHINYSPIADKKLADSYIVNFPKVDGFHAVSQAISLEAKKYGARQDKVKVIHSPIMHSIFNKYKCININTHRTIKILSVGRHHWIKGYNYAINAMKILKDKNIEFEYSIIAPGIVPESILFQVNQIELQKEVLFLEGVSQDVLLNEMKNYDVLLLPSLKEGIANVVLEAMAIGLPVISTNSGGMAEVVKPKETGWLVPVRDPEALAEAIIDVSQTSKCDLQYITQQAHLLVKAEFNAENSIKEYEALYQSLIK